MNLRGKENIQRILICSQKENKLLDILLGTYYFILVHVISRKKLKEFWSRHKDTEGPLKAWYHEAKKAHWSSWTEIKEQYCKASFVKNNRVIFNIRGNKYRLVVEINYTKEVVYIRFVGTHPEYDKIDPEVI